MAKINVLDFEVANRIAAGEVVDRPASVLKELLENAIDAGATRITAEIRRGGVAMIRVQDNGGGMAPEDLPLAIKRHATSKIRTAEDLDAIATLGFRGEALAAIASVSTLHIISKTADAPEGTMLSARSGRITEVSEVGCAVGTTVTVEELFEDVPARRKFLKKDVTEAGACLALIEKMALSRPDIAFRAVSDGATKFQTAGDGKVQDAIYAVMGRDVATRLLSASSESRGVAVRGFIGRSDNVKNTRNFQNCFINGRYVRSKTVQAALERAYTSYIAEGKFPLCVLYLTLDPSTVDVNVHPAKLEVKFTDERVVFEAVYYAARQALEEAVYRPELAVAPAKEKNPLRTFLPVDAPKAEQQTAPIFAPRKTEIPVTRPVETPAVRPVSLRPVTTEVERPAPPSSLGVRSPASFGFREGTASDAAEERIQTGSAIVPPKAENAPLLPKREDIPAARSDTAPAEEETPIAAAPSTETPAEPLPTWRIVGKLFNTYILVEMGNEALVIDQHAAHERLIFERLKAQAATPVPQSLLIPLSLSLSEEEKEASSLYRAELEGIGFSYAPTERGILLSSIPAAISVRDAEGMLTRMLAELWEGAEDPAITEEKRRERMLYQIACKAAIKGGRDYGIEQEEELVRQLLAHGDVTVCPHGRPVAFRLTLAELNRRFERT